MNLPKVLFVVTTATAAIGSAFLYGLYSGVNKNAAHDFIGRVYMAIKDSIQAVSETSILRPEHFLNPTRGPASGVTVNERPDDGSVILMSGFFVDSNELRLVRRDGSVVKRWPVKFKSFFPDASYMSQPKPPATDWNIDTHGALARPDGSVLFNFDYGGLVKLDHCGRTEWTLPRMTHHSVEAAEDGGYWVPGRREIKDVRAFPPFLPPYYEDLILRLSEDGKVESEISVPGLFYKNGLTSVLTATGENFTGKLVWDHELVHMNKIAELSHALAPKFPMFEAGDLLLSLREQNLLLVMNPATQAIKWWQIGPWIRQHDPEFSADGTLTVFNNNTFKLALEDYPSNADIPRVSDILAIDPATRQVRTVYGGRPGQEMLTVVRGKQDATREGGLFITETEAGRVFETDSNGRVIWEYINRYDKEHVAEITEARLYPQDYFKVEDWSCAPPKQ